MYCLGLYKKGSQDRACFYIIQHWHETCAFLFGQKNNLRVHHDPMGKCVKLAPHNCETFTILKIINTSTYHLDLHDGLDVHLVFHVNHLK